MSLRVRFKGRFSTKKRRDKELRAVAAMSRANAAKHDQKVHNLNQQQKFPVEGRRIVDLQYLSENLQCTRCKKDILLRNAMEETRMGLNSILHISCKECSTITQVRTGKTHITAKNSRHSDVNTKAVFGAVHSGFGETALNKLLSCLNIPTLDSHIYKKYEREVGPALEAVAKDSCRRAAEEERTLVIENMEKLCEELPQDIVEEIYPFMRTLHPSTNINLHDGAVEDDVNRRETFDAAIGNIINIIVSYDMGWSKRGNGRSYNSLNGYGTIVGFLSGKVLDFAARNRRCKLCMNGHCKSDHDCRQNFSGSAKAMEPDVGAALVNESTILKEVGLSVRVLIGDEDSSTIAAVRQGNLETIHKLADSNHLKKNFANALYDLRKDYKEMRDKEVIPHLKKCFSYALVQNKGLTVKLANSIRNIPDHVFGKHENCGAWCKDSHKITLKNQQLYDKLSAIFGKYADNAPKFSIVASSQVNESINNIMAHKAPKNCCYSLSESADNRLASTVCAKNEGEKHVLDVNTQMNVSPGKHTASFAEQVDMKRKKRAAKSKLPSSKARRNLLARNKEASRKYMEQSEGIQYQTNCGIDSSVDNTTVVDFQNLSDKIPDVLLSVETCSIIFFDLETSGFSKDSEILQIAAKFEKYKFSIYLHPSKPINADASRVTGLKYVGGKLFFHGKEVLSIPPRAALLSFQEFLQISSKPCILVAHNASFDSSHLLQYIIDNGMIDSFQNIAGFSDSLIVLKKVLLERKKEKKSFSLQTLARDLLNLESSSQFHEALFDVETLEKLCDAFTKKEDFVEVCKPYKQLLMVKTLLPTLKDLKGVISNEMVKKIAGAGIHYEILKETYLKNGEVGIKKLLSEKTISNKPKITQSTKIIDKVVEHLKNKL